VEMSATILILGRSTPWFWPAVGACAGVYLFFLGFQLLQRKRLIENTPASKIRSAAIGLVEVSGLAAGPFLIRAPITGMPCYYYRTMAWQWKQTGKSHQWVKVADESYHVPFFLEDNTGRLLIDPQGAELDIHRDFHEEFSERLFSSGLEIPTNVAGFIGRYGATDSKVKVEEYCIKPKNALFVLGTLAENPGLTVSSAPVRSVFSQTESLRIPLHFSITKQPTETSWSGSSTAKHLDPDQQAKMAAVLTKAGITSPLAWAAAGIEYAQPIALPVASNSAAAAAPAPEQFDLHPPTVLMKGKHNPAFFISWRSQREVVKSLGWKSALMIWGGPALTLLCIYILAAQFGKL
jgi:E3 Ubiquitin ligase